MMSWIMIIEWDRLKGTGDDNNDDNKVVAYSNVWLLFIIHSDNDNLMATYEGNAMDHSNDNDTNHDGATTTVLMWI